MVKNSTGGNKSKKQARSSGAVNTQQQNVRKALEEGEIYAVVTKINGGNNCQVMCNDGVIRCCFIRNKFKTFGKRENTVSVGIWILAGIRLWESRTSGIQKCDLLEVYSHTEKDRLKQTETCSFQYLLNAVEADRNNGKNGGGGIDFSTIMEEEQEDIKTKKSYSKKEDPDKPMDHVEFNDDKEDTDSSDASSSSQEEDVKKVKKQNNNTLKDLMKTTPKIQNVDDTDWLNDPVDVKTI